MSETKFHKAFPFIRDEHNENVCRVITETSFIPQRDLTPFEIDARMNLLSAAPDLLDALKDLLGLASTIEVLGEWEALDINASLRKKSRALTDAAESAARLAIAKAEGRAA